MTNQEFALNVIDAIERDERHFGADGAYGLDHAISIIRTEAAKAYIWQEVNLDQREIFALADAHADSVEDGTRRFDRGGLLQFAADIVERAAQPVAERDEYLCPNCLTPRKCNGPHILEGWESQDAKPTQMSKILSQPSKTNEALTDAEVAKLCALSVPELRALISQPEQTKQDEQAKFEAWYHKCGDEEYLKRDSDGVYEDGNTRCGWMAWKARALIGTKRTRP